MFNKRKLQQVNSLSNLKRTDEYKNYSNMAIVFATRYCIKHRKELLNKDDVKHAFDTALSLYKKRKLNKLEVENEEA